jgi:hypothetical protein
MVVIALDELWTGMIIARRLIDGIILRSRLSSTGALEYTSRISRRL